MGDIDHIIGIDLGTTNSVVAMMEGTEARVISNTEGQPKTPSVIAVQENGDFLVGELARRQAATQPDRTISSAKRLLGRLYNEIDNSDEQYPFDLGEDGDGRVQIFVGDQPYSPEAFSAEILKKLKSAAEDVVGVPIYRAIVTVPAYFDDLQRQATMEAGRLAGLKIERLLNEPTAAAMAYGLGRESEPETVAIYDFGGGTFDFSVLDIEEHAYEVRSTTGDSRLGGDDLDNLLVDFIADQFLEETEVDLRDDSMALRRLKDAAEAAKCQLSTAMEAPISLPFVAQKDGNPVHLEMKLHRDDFEDLIEPFIERSLEACQRGLEDAGLTREQITRVILVGGSTRVPLVREMVEDFFEQEPFRGVNPDEVVAIGAAMQGAVLMGSLEEVVLLDVTPHSLGIELKGNRKSTIIDKNSTIPIKAFKTFTTTEKDQSFVNIHVLQGESDKANACRSLGRFSLTGIEPAPAGTPRIRVTFFINADGIVEISASNMASGEEQKLTISHAYLGAEERKVSSSGTGTGTQKRRRRRKRRRSPGSTQERISQTDSGTGASKSSTSERKKAAAIADVTEEDQHQSEAELSDTGNVIRVSPGDDHSHDAAPVDDTDERPAVAPAPEAQETPRKEEPATAKEQAPEPKSESEPEQAKPTAKPAASEQKDASEEEDFDAIESVYEVMRKVSSHPPVEETVAYNRSTGKDNVDTSQTVAQTRGATQPTLLRPQTQPPRVLQPVIDMLCHGRNNEDAIRAYTDHQELITRFCLDHPSDHPLQLLFARFHLYLRQPEQARSCLVEIIDNSPESSNEVYEIYNRLCNDFPNYVAGRKDRAKLAVSANELTTAIRDYEFLSEREENDPDVLEQLCELYQQALHHGPDCTMQFKLVKIYLKRRELDSAISQLQQLVLEPQYRDRANKVMGLCFWQKEMRYLAWQKFRTLPIDDELKDVLYRLADDMEMHDELAHAKGVFERIYEVDINYADVGERLKKLDYRLELEREERYASGPSVSSGSMPSVIGQRFEVVEEINRGSMGIVYKARDRQLDEIVAIKVLNDFLCSDPKAVERFKQECRSSRKLTHQNIVRIHDMFDLDGKKIISMEFIEGEDMKTMLLRETRFAEKVLLNYLTQICEGLAFAHKLNVVHRDIKPANLMLDSNQMVKITDFGIAKLVDNEQSKAGTVIMGTPLYMSPEQIEGKKIDLRCDIYSLGITLYELVAGKPPFFEGNVEYQHLHNKPEPPKADISEPFKALIMKCIEKNPSDRFASIEELIQALELLP